MNNDTKEKVNKELDHIGNSIEELQLRIFSMVDEAREQYMEDLLALTARMYSMKKKIKKIAIKTGKRFWRSFVR